MLTRRLADCPQVPWRNGAGTTRELYLDDDLRVTVASERNEAAFSDFSGWSRTIVPLGEGLSLLLGERPEVAIPALSGFAFSGAQRVRARLAAGPIDAFNIMTRDGALAHRMLSLPLAKPQGEQLSAIALFVLRGTLPLGGERLAAGTFALAAGREECGEIGRIVPPADALALVFALDRSRG
ncbi:MAG: HutD family protein [Candidatus Baltobacteraceae bacterium]